MSYLKLTIMTTFMCYTLHFVASGQTTDTWSEISTFTTRENYSVDFPMTIGTTWYYQHNAKAPRYGYDSMYALRKEIIDTLKSGFRVVRITNYFKSKTTTGQEYLYFNDGKFYQTTLDTLKYEDFPRYNAEYTKTMTFGSGYGQNWIYTLEFSSIFGVTAKSQIELTYWQLHGGSSSETYTTALGFGVIRYIFNNGDAADRSDSTILVGMVKNGIVFGDTMLVDPDKRPVLLTPSENNSNQIIGQYAFTWTRSLGGISYRLQIATDSLFTQIFEDYHASIDTVKFVNGLAYGIKYFWRVQARCSDGGSYWSIQRQFTTIDQGAPGAFPTQFSLYQNYPNPFNPSTTIGFSLPSPSFVTLKIFDVMGREVASVVSEELPAGNYSRQWNASGMPSGVYFYRLQAGSYTETKRICLVK